MELMNWSKRTTVVTPKGNKSGTTFLFFGGPRGRCFVSDGRHRTLIQLARHFVNLRVVRTLTSRSALSGIEGLNDTVQAREGVHISVFRISF